MIWSAISYIVHVCVWPLLWDWRLIVEYILLKLLNTQFHFKVSKSVEALKWFVVFGEADKKDTSIVSNLSAQIYNDLLSTIAACNYQDI